MTIYVHSGMFHADDCLAAAILLMVEDFGTDVVRVRELPETFNPETDAAADVGGVYDTTRNMFDHHQKGGSDDLRAAAGKVWKQFGLEICRSQRVADRVYAELVQPIDLADIGQRTWEAVGGFRPLSASHLISMANLPMGATESEISAAFTIAVDMMKVVLAGCIANAQQWVKMQEVVHSADRLVVADEEDPWEGNTLILRQGGPWQEHVLADRNLQDIKYIVYPSDRGGFLLQCVPDALGSFGQRKSLPKEWAGLRGKDFADITGLESFGSATFCHPGCFIAGAETLEDAKWLAIKAEAA